MKGNQSIKPEELTFVLKLEHLCKNGALAKDPLRELLIPKIDLALALLNGNVQPVYPNQVQDLVQELQATVISYFLD